VKENESHRMPRGPNRSLPEGLLPRTRSCIVCGRDNPRGYHLRSRLRDGAVELLYTTRPEDTGYVGVVHGGVLATLLDEVMTWAAIVASGRMCVAASFSIRLHRPLPPHTRILVSAPVPQPRRLMEVSGTVQADQLGLVAEARGRYLRATAAAGAQAAADFVADPDAIPLERLLRPHRSSPDGDSF